MIGELVRRLRGAWHFLRCGAPPSPPTESGTLVTGAELREAAMLCFIGADLPEEWPSTATSEQIKRARSGVWAAQMARECDWEQLEAELSIVP